MSNTRQQRADTNEPGSSPDNKRPSAGAAGLNSVEKSSIGWRDLGKRVDAVLDLAVNQPVVPKVQESKKTATATDLIISDARLGLKKGLEVGAITTASKAFNEAKTLEEAKDALRASGSPKGFTPDSTPPRDSGQSATRSL